MLEAIKYNLSRLLDFAGRENRPTFWWYVLALAILDFVLSLIVSGPMMAGSISAAMQAAQSGATPEALQAQMIGRMSGQMATLIWVSGAIHLLFIVLSVAAFVRRLHDSNNSGWWAAVAIAAQVVSFAVSLAMIGPITRAMHAAAASGNLDAMVQQQSHLSRYGLIGWIGPIVVIVFGVMKSTAGANRYGEPQPTV